jgi:putative ABC transport system permease protein
VLYNLGMLVYLEMERELATLKVLGMRTRKLRMLLLTQALLLSAVGFVAGIPTGMALLKMIVTFSGDSFDMPTDLHLQTLLVCLLFTFALVIAVNLFFSRRVNQIDMVTSLKAPE